MKFNSLLSFLLCMWQARQWQPVIDPLSVVMRGGVGGGLGQDKGLRFRGCQVCGWRVLGGGWLVSWHRHRNQHVCGKPRIVRQFAAIYIVSCACGQKPVCRGSKCPRVPRQTPLGPPTLAARFHSSTTNCCMQPPVVNLFTYLFTDIAISATVLSSF